MLIKPSITDGNSKKNSFKCGRKWVRKRINDWKRNFLAVKDPQIAMILAMLAGKASRDLATLNSLVNTVTEQRTWLVIDSDL
jgi:hypothetical protein